MKYRLGLSAEPMDSTINSRLEGVGMIRSEYLCRQKEEYVTIPSCRDHIRQYVENICTLFYPHEVWYRTTELVVPEINVLKGADEIFEEKHYAFGMRGVRRGINYKDTFKTELENIVNISKKHKNLGILFPYIGGPEELVQCLELLDGIGYKGPYGIMAEIPSSILLLDDFIDLGISNITIGINDLTALTLGTYRGATFHNPLHPSVIKIIEMAVRTAKKRQVPISIAGYFTKAHRLAYEKLGIDWFIVHYTSLPSVLDIDPNKLPHLGLLKEIKKITKSRIAEREVDTWKKFLSI